MQTKVFLAGARREDFEIGARVSLRFPPPSPLSALVVEPDDTDAVFYASALTSAGFIVTLTDNFADARHLIDVEQPLVLVTQLRLGAHNGLHLALRDHTRGTRMRVVVISAAADPVLEREAERAGATFVVRPIAASDLIAAVYRTALRAPSADGTLEPVRPPFERRHTERRSGPAVFGTDERRVSERRRDLARLLGNASLS
jgi:DNA-binding response OmpR family regulator